MSVAPLPVVSDAVSSPDEQSTDVDETDSRRRHLLVDRAAAHAALKSDTEGETDCQKLQSIK